MRLLAQKLNHICVRYLAYMLLFMSLALTVAIENMNTVDKCVRCTDTSYVPLALKRQFCKAYLTRKKGRQQKRWKAKTKTRLVLTPTVQKEQQKTCQNDRYHLYNLCKKSFSSIKFRPLIQRRGFSIKINLII